MRILFTSTAGAGHLVPLFPLARAARAAGHQVRFALPGVAAGLPTRLGFDVSTTDSGIPGPAEMAFWQSLSSYENDNEAVLGEFFGRLRPTAVLEPTAAIVAEFRPDLIVSEQAEFAGRLQAERHGLPHVTVAIATTELSDTSLQLMIDNLDAVRESMGLPATGENPWYAGTRFVSGVPSVLQMPATPLPDGTLRYRYEDAEGPVIRRPHRPRGDAASTPRSAPPPDGSRRWRLRSVRWSRRWVRWMPTCSSPQVISTRIGWAPCRRTCASRRTCRSRRP